MLSSWKFFLVFLYSSFVVAQESPLLAPMKFSYQVPEHCLSWELGHIRDKDYWKLGVLKVPRQTMNVS